MNIFNIKKVLGKTYSEIKTVEDDEGEILYNIFSFCKAFAIDTEYDEIVRSIPSEYICIAYAKDPVTFCPVGKPTYYVTLEGLEHIILNSDYEQLYSTRKALIELMF